MLLRATDVYVQTVVTAVLSKRKIYTWYGGGYRTLEPHAIGIGGEGQYLLRGFQVSGYSRSRQQMGWKLLRVDEMSDVVCLEEGFWVPRPQYVRGDRHMRRILAQV